MQQITKTSTATTKKNILNRISDVPGGISLTLADLVAGSVVPEGTPISAPSSGVRTICKSAVLLTGSTTTVFVVDTETNQFKVGDILMQTAGAKAYAITVVTDNGDGTTDLTVGTALEAATVGIFIYQSSAAGATAAVLSNAAKSILKSPFTVPSTTQVVWIKDAFIRADVVEGVIGAAYLATLPGIIEVQY